MASHDFDVTRAHLSDKDDFKPFYVKQSHLLALQAALASGKVNADTELLLLDHPQEALALVKGQMAYHHVAQGEIAGEPWLVSF